MQIKLKQPHHVQLKEALKMVKTLRELIPLNLENQLNSLEQQLADLTTTLTSKLQNKVNEVNQGLQELNDLKTMNPVFRYQTTPYQMNYHPTSDSEEQVKSSLLNRQENDSSSDAEEREGNFSLLY